MNDPEITLSPLEKAVLEAAPTWRTLEEIQVLLADFYRPLRVRSAIASLRRYGLLAQYSPHIYKQTELGMHLLRMSFGAMQHRRDHEIARHLRLVSRSAR
jgi:hypothetical protein